MPRGNSHVPKPQIMARTMYTRPEESRRGTTQLPEMNQISKGVDRADATVATSRPVIGFLYSVSRTAGGEYWPLSIGENTIGRSDDCDVCLKELTVSEHHAILNIRQMKSTKKLLITLSVTGKNGGFVNDTEVGSAPIDCASGDILTIGDNYKLYLLAVNAHELGLTVSPDFIPDGSSSFSTPVSPDYEDRTRDPYDHTERREDGTLNMDGSSSSNYTGYTQML